MKISKKICVICLILVFVFCSIVTNNTTVSHASDIIQGISYYYKYETYGYKTPDGKYFEFNEPVMLGKQSSTEDSNIFENWVKYMINLDPQNNYVLYVLLYGRPLFKEYEFYASLCNVEQKYESLEEIHDYVNGLFNKYRVGKWVLVDTVEY